MVEEGERQIDARLEERSFEVHKLTKNWMEMMNQLLIKNQESNKKDMEIIRESNKTNESSHRGGCNRGRSFNNCGR